MTWLTNPYRFGAPTAPPAEHAYWQAFILDNTHDSNQIAGLEFAATPGGPDQCTGGTVLSGAPDGVGYLWGTPANAFDANAATSTAVGLGQNTRYGYWLGYGKAAPFPVAEVRAQATISDASNTPQRAPTGVLVRGSNDGITWLTYGLIQWPSLWTDNEIRAGAVSAVPWNTSGRANAHGWRIYCTARNEGNVWTAKIKLAATPGGPNLAVPGNGIAFSSVAYLSLSRFSPAAFDETANIWSDTPFSTPNFVGWMFPSAQDLAEVRVTSSGSFSPADYTIDYSPDGVTWTTVATETGATWDSGGQTRVYSI